MGIEPGQIIGGGSSESHSDHLFIWIQDGKLADELFCLAARVCRCEKRAHSGDRSRNGGYELDDDLMGNPERAVVETAPQQLDRPPLLLGVTRIVFIDDNVGVNEGGHGRRGPPASSPGPAALLGISCRPGGVAVGGPIPRRASIAPPEKAGASFCRSRSESLRRPKRSGSHVPAESRADR